MGGETLLYLTKAPMVDSGAIATLEKEKSLGGSIELMIIILDIWYLKCL